jgi:hypothetical protein
MPSFADYEVSDTSITTTMPVDLSSADGASRFRTVLREGAARGPNFAGHYTVVHWGCGSPCVSFAIVDASTGSVYMHSQAWVRPPMFRRDSRLLIEDPTGFMTDSLGHPSFATVVRYHEWTGDSLVTRDTIDAAVVRLSIESP